MKRLAFLSLFLIIFAHPTFAQSKPKKVVVCQGCHGPTGVSPSPTYPNLAGQHAAYLAKQLKDFRSGARTDQTMNAISGKMTDAEIDELAKYYEALGKK